MKCEVEKELLLEAAQCLDDCLIRIYPEEFTENDVKETFERWKKAGGTIARIANLADKLRAVK